MADTDKSQANVFITIDGETRLATHTREGEIDTFSGITITRVHVDQRIDCPGMFSIDYELLIDMALTFIDTIEEGQEVEISLGYESRGTMPVIFVGEVTAIEPIFGKEKAILTISGYDFSHRLTRGNSTRSFDSPESPELQALDVMEDVATKTGFSFGTGEVESSSNSPKYWNLPQLATNDYEFIQSLGHRLGYHQQEGSPEEMKSQLSIGKTQLDSPVITVVRDLRDGENPVPAIEARFRLNAVKQFERVEVRGWDPSKKQNIIGIAEDLSVDFNDSGKTGPDIARVVSRSKSITVVDQPIRSQEEADQMAQSILDGLGMELITGEAEFEGVPSLRAGSVIAFLGYGDRFDGNYLVTACHHMYQPGESAYTCRVEFHRNYIRDSSIG